MKGKFTTYEKMNMAQIEEAAKEVMTDIMSNTVDALVRHEKEILT